MKYNTALSRIVETLDLFATQSDKCSEDTIKVRNNEM